MKNNAESIATIAVVAILFSLATVTQQQQMAMAQMTFGEWCGAICDAQKEWLQNTEEAMEVSEAEQLAVQFDREENVRTLEEFMTEAEAEDEFDKGREAEEQEENGIEIDEETGEPVAASARLVRDHIETKNALLNQTFTRLLSNTNETAADIEEVEEEIDIDEVAQRQIIFYEFNEDITDDDIRIYTIPAETVQALASTISTNINTTGIELFENGRMIISYDGVYRFDDADDTRIYAPHNYTAINGCRYENNTIYDLTGNETLKEGIPSLP